MPEQTTATGKARPLGSVPANWTAYVAVFAALVSAAIHLFLAPRVMGFDQLIGVLFYLNGLGWIGGTILFLSRYWRRPFYLVAIGYAALTIVAYVAFAGPVNVFAVASKGAEAIVAVAAGYLYYWEAASERYS
jgi:hypothetical protein